MSGKKSNSSGKAHRERGTGRSRQTGYSNPRNNNQDMDGPSRISPGEEPNVNPDGPGIGDSTWNNDKLTNYTSNHSADA